MNTCPTDQKWDNDPQEAEDETCKLCGTSDTITEDETDETLCKLCIEDLGKYLGFDEEADIQRYENAEYYDGEFHFESV